MDENDRTARDLLRSAREQAEANAEALNELREAVRDYVRAAVNGQPTADTWEQLRELVGE